MSLFPTNLCVLTSELRHKTWKKGLPAITGRRMDYRHILATQCTGLNALTMYRLLRLSEEGSKIRPLARNINNSKRHILEALRQSLLDLRHGLQSVWILDVTGRYLFSPPNVIVPPTYAAFQLAIYHAPMFLSFVQFQTNPNCAGSGIIMSNVYYETVCVRLYLDQMRTGLLQKSTCH